MRQENDVQPRPGVIEFSAATRRTRADAEGTVRVHLDLTAPVPVLQISGRLDRGAIRPCREALDWARQANESTVVMDLSRVTASARDTIPLLGAMRRFLAAGGVGMTLVRVPGDLEAAMRDLGVWGMYQVAPDVAEIRDAN